MAARGLGSPAGLCAGAGFGGVILDVVDREESLPPGAELQPPNGSNLIPLVGFA